MKTTTPANLVFKHWPLTREDIILDRVNYEDRILHSAMPTPLIPPSVQEEASRIPFTPASAYAFGRNIFRRSVSIMMP